MFKFTASNTSLEKATAYETNFMGFERNLGIDPHERKVSGETACVDHGIPKPRALELAADGVWSSY